MKRESRTRDFPATKEKLLDAAGKLIVEKGFPATTLDEVCDGAGVTKGCFFHYFSGKEELGKELIHRAMLSHAQAIENFPHEKERDPLKRVYASIDQAIESFKDDGSLPGCIIGTLAQELSGTSPEIRDALGKSFEAWSDRIGKDLEEAKALHAPRSPVHPKSLAYYFISLLEGSMILAKAQNSGAAARANLKMFKEHLRELFGK